MEEGPRREFRDDDRIKMLLWCNRRCCLCGKACGTNIEIAHIDPRGPGEIDNAIPLCFECHADTGHYNPAHPRGNKYRPQELKARREQIYEQETRALVPPIHYEVTQQTGDGGRRVLPDIGFNIIHVGDSLPVQVLVTADIFHESVALGPPDRDLYAGQSRWNLNPRSGVRGHFLAPQQVTVGEGRLETRISLTVIDQYERHHPLLPLSWIFMGEENWWFLHPVPSK